MKSIYSGIKLSGEGFSFGGGGASDDSGKVGAVANAGAPGDVINVTGEDSVINTDNAVASGFLPNGVYAVRFTKITDRKSKQGSPQQALDFEIVSPATVLFNNKRLTAAGAKGTVYLTYSNSGVNQVIQMLRTAGMEIIGNHTVKQLMDKARTLVGGVGPAVVNAQERFEMVTQTEEQVAAGEVPVNLMDAEGNPISRGFSLNFSRLHGRVAAGM